MDTVKFLYMLCAFIALAVLVMWVILWRKEHGPIMLPEVMVVGNSNASHLGGLEQ